MNESANGAIPYTTTSIPESNTPVEQSESHIMNVDQGTSARPNSPLSVTVDYSARAKPNLPLTVNIDQSARAMPNSPLTVNVGQTHTTMSSSVTVIDNPRLSRVSTKSRNNNSIAEVGTLL